MEGVCNRLYRAASLLRPEVWNMFVRPHNGAILSFRRTLAITLRACHGLEVNLRPLCVPVAALLGMLLGRRHSTCMCPRHDRATVPQSRDAHDVLRCVS